MLSSSSPTSLLPSTAVRPAPFAPTATVALPKLRISAGQQRETGHGYDDTRAAVGYHAAPPVSVKTEAPSGTVVPSPHGPTTRSPSSPSSFFTQPEIAKTLIHLNGGHRDTHVHVLPLKRWWLHLEVSPRCCDMMQLGLTPLLEAAEQVRPSMPETSPSLYGRSSPLKRELPGMQTLPSIMHAMGGYPLEASTMPKRARVGSDVGQDMQASYSLLGHMPRQAMIYPSVPQHSQSQLYQCQATLPTTEAQSPTSSSTNTQVYSGASVWETVLTTGKFPVDICLSENGAVGGPPTAPFNPNTIQSNSNDAAELAGADAVVELKQGRWSADEKEYANALIQAVERGEVLLPPNVSLRKFVADNLQCKTMR
ncbi:hypothetical protein PHPALM_27655, partial [Phytophthora palmivora]